MEGLAAMRAKEARHNETDSKKLNEKLQSTEACEIIKWSQKTNFEFFKTVFAGLNRQNNSYNKG